MDLIPTPSPIEHLFEFLKWMVAAVFLPCAGLVIKAFRDQRAEIKETKKDNEDEVNRVEAKIDNLHQSINAHAKEVAELYARKADVDRFSERIEDKMDDMQAAVTARIDNLQSTLLPLISAKNQRTKE